MSNLTLVLLLVAGALIVLDLVLPTGGLLAGLGLATLIERMLAVLDLGLAVRLPLAAVGMAAGVLLGMKYGERLSDRLLPGPAPTNLDRLAGLRGVVRQVEPGRLVVEVDGDLWSARRAPNTPPLVAGARVRVVSVVSAEQLLVVGPEEVT